MPINTSRFFSINVEHVMMKRDDDGKYHIIPNQYITRVIDDITGEIIEDHQYNELIYCLQDLPKIEQRIFIKFDLDPEIDTLHIKMDVYR